jgi:tetratricopeptide (TPR) repeat protein
MKFKRQYLIIGGVIILLLTCGLVAEYHQSSHEAMIALLSDMNKRNNSLGNGFNPEVKLAHVDSLLKIKDNEHDPGLLNAKAALALKVGKEEESVATYKDLLTRVDYMSMERTMPDVAIAYMRLGERNNCMLNHNGSSCIFPIKDGGVHKIQTGSKKAIEVYEGILTAHPEDLESKWLLNIAFMTLGQYP